MIGSRGPAARSATAFRALRALPWPARTARSVRLQADGAGMYSLQALWTQAREKLDVVNIVFANRVYKILYGELRSTGAEPGRASDTLFDLGVSDLDWVGLAKSVGVEAVSADTGGVCRYIPRRLRPPGTVSD